MGEVALAVRGDLKGGAPDMEIHGVSTDTRTLAAGQLFVALRGPNFDGHKFIGEAIQKGASAAVADREQREVGALPVCVVEDTLRALGDLATFHRRRNHRARVVAITGSAGKTGTKDMLASILRLEGPTLATRGNLNNLIGVPLTLFGLEPVHRFAVIEMGMNVPGEIARLTEIAQPNVGVITNVALAHAEGVGGIEGVARAKGELFAGLGSDHYAAVNLDDPRIAAMLHDLAAKPITFGRAPEAQVRLLGDPSSSLAGTRFHVAVSGQTLDVTIPQLGAHQAHNAMAAMAATLPLGVTPEVMVQGLSMASGAPGRLTVRLSAELAVLDDTYNANPRSAEVALKTLADLAETHRPVAVLGDMLELGEHSVEAHRRVGLLAAETVSELFAFGPAAAEIAVGARAAGMKDVFHTLEFDILSQEVGRRLQSGDIVLVKGSRGMRLERLVRALLPNGGGA